MPRKAEAGTGGGGRWIDKEGWLALAKDEAIVVIKRVERVDDYVNPRGEHAEQYRVEVIVCSSKGGKRTGEYYPPFNMTSRAIVSKFGDPIEPDSEGKGGRQGAVDGEVIGARIVALGSGASSYPGATPPRGPEWEAVEKFYAANECTFDEDGDAKLFKVFAARYAEANRAELRDAKAKVADKGAERGADADDDDTPPF
jgi:hypothetical protein